MNAERELAERVLKAWEACPVDDNGFGETVILARAYLAMVPSRNEIIEECAKVSEECPLPHLCDDAGERCAIAIRALKDCVTTPQHSRANETQSQETK